MENTELKILSAPRYVDDAALSKGFLSKVFNWMFLALAISGITAYGFASIPGLHDLLYGPENRLNTLGMILRFAPLGFVLLISFRFEKMSYGSLVGLFLSYAAVMGMSLSAWLLYYSTASVVAAFGGAAGMFGVMAIAGARTNTDLTKFGSIMFIGLIGLVIASVINWFLHSPSLAYIISLVGVLVFMGLTAWDVQKLKTLGNHTEISAEDRGKLSIMGALTLYLDFVNIFLFLLQLFGGRRNN